MTWDNTFGRSASAHFDVGRVILETPYDEDFVEQLKEAVPSHGRSWDPKDRVWLISSEYWDTAAEVVEEYFDLSV